MQRKLLRNTYSRGNLKEKGKLKKNREAVVTKERLIIQERGARKKIFYMDQDDKEGIWMKNRLVFVSCGQRNKISERFIAKEMLQSGTIGLFSLY